MSNFHATIIGVLFYIGWFGCIFLAKSQYNVFSLSFPLILIGFLYLNKYLNFKNTLLAFSISSLGVFFDSIAIKVGWIYIEEPNCYFWIPIWLIAIWLLFSFSMVKLGMIFNPPLWLAAILGFTMGPLSYQSGQIFGVLLLAMPYGFIIYGFFWAWMFPVVLKLAKRFS